jgi:hypothetical protein
MTDQTPQTPDATSPATIAETPLLVWSTHPAKQRPMITLAVVVLLLIIVAAVYAMTFSPPLTVLSAIVLYGSLTQYFTSTTFEFTNSKIRIKYIVNKVEKDWSQYRSYYADKNGVLLSPFAGPSRLENFRGLYVRFAANKDQVMEIVRQKINYTPDKD